MPRIERMWVLESRIAIAIAVSIAILVGVAWAALFVLSMPYIRGGESERLRNAARGRGSPSLLV